MGNILVVMKTDDNHKEWLKKAAGEREVIFNTSPTDEQLLNAEIIVGNPKFDKIATSEKLKFLQIQSAGIGRYLELNKKGITVCGATGAYGLAISEHMFGMMLGLKKKLFDYRIQQLDGNWNDLGEVESIYGANVLVLGMGDIGGEFAKRCHAFGAHVKGICRTKHDCPEYAEEIGTPEDIDRWLPEADIVFMCMPDTPESTHTMNWERLSRMKKTAILLNAGRGTAVDSMALYDALNDGRIGGAGLEVTDPEPLPSSHPLWMCKNIIITPHISGGLHLKETHNRIVRIACENIKAYTNGGKLRNKSDTQRGY